MQTFASHERETHAVAWKPRRSASINCLEQLSAPAWAALDFQLSCSSGRKKVNKLMQGSIVDNPQPFIILVVNTVAPDAGQCAF